jgi:hypothetical protein
VGRHRRSRMFRSLQRVSAQRLRQIVSNLVLLVCALAKDHDQAKSEVRE